MWICAIGRGIFLFKVSEGKLEENDRWITHLKKEGKEKKLTLQALVALCFRGYHSNNFFRLERPFLGYKIWPLLPLHLAQPKIPIINENRKRKRNVIRIYHILKCKITSKDKKTKKRKNEKTKKQKNEKTKKWKNEKTKKRNSRGKNKYNMLISALSPSILFHTEYTAQCAPDPI